MALDCHGVDRLIASRVRDSSQCSFHLDRFRNHVVRRAGADLRHRDDDGIERVDAARDYHLERLHDLRGYRHRVVGEVGRRRVPALSRHDDTENVSGCHQRTRFGPDRARRQVRRHVQREDGIDVGTAQ